MADRRSALLGALAGGAVAPTYAPQGAGPQSALSPMMAQRGGGSCGGGGSPFAEYAPAGLVKFTLSAAGAQTVTASIDVTGSDLPADSVVVLGDYVDAAGASKTTAGMRIAEFRSDNQPSALGAGGAAFSLLDLNNQNAPGVNIQRRATRQFSVAVEFTPAAAINDVLTLQVLAPGGRFLAAQSCAV